MGFGIYSSINGAKSREIELEVLANNVANMQTVGFKEVNVSFTHELSQASGSNAQTDALNSTSFVSKNHINHAQGSIYKTDNPLDIALQGDGLFTITTPQGTRYTRNGHFSLDKDGQLITQQGDFVQGTNGTIKIPNSETLTVGNSGTLSTSSQNLGALKIASFAEKDSLKLDGNNYFEANVQAQDSKGFVATQGFLESSNVNMVRNLTKIIEVSRAYESHQKSLSKQYEAMQMLNQIAKMTT